MYNLSLTDQCTSPGVRFISSLSVLCTLPGVSFIYNLLVPSLYQVLDGADVSLQVPQLIYPVTVILHWHSLRL